MITLTRKDGTPLGTLDAADLQVLVDQLEDLFGGRGALPAKPTPSVLTAIRLRHRRRSTRCGVDALGRQLAVKLHRLRVESLKSAAFPVGSGWLEHPTSAMSTLRSNQLS